jgi:tetratricopeptide (TPR) repeat protein
MLKFNLGMLYILRKFSCLVLLGLLFMQNHVVAQLSTVYTEEYAVFKTGQELYDKAQYSAAQDKFKQTVEGIDNSQDEIRINAEYYVAVCALELFHKDAEHLLNRFAFNHPDHPKTKTIYFQLGKYYYRTKAFKKVIEYMEKVDIFDLTADEKIEYNFKLAYSYFYRDQFPEAKVLFHEVIQTENDYSIPAYYYYGHIAYTEDNYQTALESFEKIENEKMFARVIPYYVTQIYYKQEKYDELIDYAPIYLDSVSQARRPEFAKLIGDAYYYKEMYKEAIPFLMEYRKGSPSAREDAYQLGYAQYRTGNFEQAGQYFRKVVFKKDAMSQIAYYHLADNYLKLGEKDHAHNAFKAASELDFDDEIKKNSLYNYAKLAYELSYNPYDEAIEAFHLFIETYPNDPLVDEAYEFLLKVYMTTKNYSEALKSLSRIKKMDNRMKMAYQSLSFNLATEQFHNGEYQDAIDSYEMARKYTADKIIASESYYWSGEAFFNLEEFDKSVASYVEFKLEPGAALSKQFYNADYGIAYAYFMKSSPFQLIENFDQTAVQSDHNALLEQSVVAFRNFLILKNRVGQPKLIDAYLRLADCYYLLRNDGKAVEYYDIAINEGDGDLSYAYYQKALALGTLERFKERAETLVELAEKYPNSNYISTTVLELASTYLTLKEYSKAITKYKEFVNDNPTNASVAMALANIGVCYVRLNDYTNARKYTLKVLDDYPNDKTENDKAIQTMKSIYEAENNINGYYDWLADRGIQVNPSERDSVLWKPVLAAFNAGECDKIISNGKVYLEKVPGGASELDAHFYMAQCYYAIDKEEALIHYNFVISKANNQHYEEALQYGSYLTYEKEDFFNAVILYNKLEMVATKEENIRKSIIAQLYCHKNLKNNAKIIEYADKVLTLPNIEQFNKIEAKLYKGLALKASSQFADALIELKSCADMSTTIQSAEAKYSFAEIHFDLGNHVECETAIMELVKLKPSYQYWIGKSIILLGRNYMALEDYFNAKHSLQSVVNNYDGKDKAKMVNTAQKLIDEIIAIENGGEKKSFVKPEEEIEFDGTNEKDKQLFQNEGGSKTETPKND